jgi:hypothetical protein
LADGTPVPSGTPSIASGIVAVPKNASTAQTTPQENWKRKRWQAPQQKTEQPPAPPKTPEKLEDPIVVVTAHITNPDGSSIDDGTGKGIAVLDMRDTVTLLQSPEKSTGFLFGSKSLAQELSEV